MLIDCEVYATQHSASAQYMPEHDADAHGPPYWRCRCCAPPPPKCQFPTATLLSRWPMPLLVVTYQSMLSVHATHTAQTRLKLPKCILFQYCRWKWLLAYAPSTRSRSYISTAKSIYTDQIAHLRLLPGGTTPPNTSQVLYTC